MRNSTSLSIVLSNFLRFTLTGLLCCLIADQAIAASSNCNGFKTPESYLNAVGKQAVTELVKCGWNVNNSYRIQNGEGSITVTALQLQVTGRNLKTVKELLDNGADPNFNPDQKNGMSALDSAISAQDYPMAFLLIQHGANLNYITPGLKLNAYMQLAYDKKQDANVDKLLEMLKKSDANTDYQDPKGRTALHLAAALNNAAYAGKLLALNANPCIRDKAGRLPIDVAIQRNHPEVRTLLESRDGVKCH